MRTIYIRLPMPCVRTYHMSIQFSFFSTWFIRFDARKNTERISSLLLFRLRVLGASSFSPCSGSLWFLWFLIIIHVSLFVHSLFCSFQCLSDFAEHKKVTFSIILRHCFWLLGLRAGYRFDSVVRISFCFYLFLEKCFDCMYSTSHWPRHCEASEAYINIITIPKIINRKNEMKKKL